MNPLDRWREILDVLRRRKLRTALTALSVAWGIFMLVVLLAAGNGLATGVQGTFARDAINAVWVNTGMVSKAHAGTTVGRRIRFDTADRDLVRPAVPFARAEGAVVGVGDRLVRLAGRQGSFRIQAVEPSNEVVERAEVVSGRYLNDADLVERRKVAVIGRKVVEVLFDPGADPLGAVVNVGQTAFEVVGVFRDENQEDEERTVLVPLSTARLAFGLGNRVDYMAFTVGDAPVDKSEGALDGLRRMLAARKGFSPEDKRAVRIDNNQEQFGKLQALFAGINAFVWLIGIGTILAAVVGVSNIMLISVTERTREIGVRKAVGAPPSAIVRMVVEEALLITFVAGYLGLVAAVAIITAVARVMPKTDYFAPPQVDLGIGLAATLVLVVAGTLAGLYPAVRAARVNPIAALRVE